MLTPGILLPLRRRQGGGGCATRCDTSRGLPREVLPLERVGRARSALFQRHVYLRQIRGGVIGAEGLYWIYLRMRYFQEYIEYVSVIIAVRHICTNIRQRDDVAVPRHRVGRTTIKVCI